MSTLKFAHRAKSVRNAAHVNEDADQRTLLRKYEQELRKLRAELQQRQREVVDKRHLLVVRHSVTYVLYLYRLTGPPERLMIGECPWAVLLCRAQTHLIV